MPFTPRPEAWLASWRASQSSSEIRYYLGLPAGDPTRAAWLRSGRGDLPKMKGNRGRSKAQIQKLVRKETFGGRFQCHSCDLRFKTRRARRHHERYSHKHVGRVKVSLILFSDVEATVTEVPFNPPRKRRSQE